MDTDAQADGTISPLKALLRFPFQEPDWQNKFIIGTALLWASTIVPILPAIFAQGYALQLMRQAVNGDRLSLPAWDDWGKLGRDGLWGLAVAFVYLLPAIIIFCGGITLYMTSIFVFPFVGALSDNAGAAAGVVTASVFGSMAVFFASLFVGMLLFLVGFVPIPVALARAVAHDELSAAFRFRRVWQQLWADKASYFTAWVVVGGLLTAAYLLFMVGYYTLILICAIPFLLSPVLFYVMLIGSALFGEVYREGVGDDTMDKSALDSAPDEPGLDDEPDEPSVKPA